MIAALDPRDMQDYRAAVEFAESPRYPLLRNASPAVSLSRYGRNLGSVDGCTDGLRRTVCWQRQMHHRLDIQLDRSGDDFHVHSEVYAKFGRIPLQHREQPLAPSARYRQTSDRNHPGVSSSAAFRNRNAFPPREFFRSHAISSSHSSNKRSWYWRGRWLMVDLVLVADQLLVGEIEARVGLLAGFLVRTAKRRRPRLGTWNIHYLRQSHHQLAQPSGRISHGGIRET